MKKLLFLFIFFSYTPFLFAQYKYNAHWVLGQDGWYPQAEPKQGGIHIDFNFEPPHIDYRQLPFALGPMTMMSDSAGKFLFFSGGCSIANRNFTMMDNGDKLNWGIYQVNYCSDSYPFEQALVSIPNVINKNKYILFHLKNGDTGAGKPILYQTEIDISQGNGLGKVTSKNIRVADDSSYCERLTAVKHGNGRDWWILLPVDKKNEYHAYYYGPQGIKNIPQKQNIGPVINEYQIGQACFSPKGDKYARCDKKNGLLFFDFDRCSGLLSNPKTFLADSTFSGGVAFSPNGRFLYYTQGLRVYQFDFESSDVLGSKKIVAVYDGFLDAFGAAVFYQMMLAPNGKIYIVCIGTSTVMHTIHNPNEKGVACTLKQHDFQLPARHWTQIPNFPYYNLFDKQGAICDTLGIDKTDTTADKEAIQSNDETIIIYPNPANGQLNINIEQPFKSLIISDITGQRIKRIATNDSEKIYTIDTFDLKDGIYFITGITTDGRQAAAQRFVVLH